MATRQLCKTRICLSELSILFLDRIVELERYSILERHRKKENVYHCFTCRKPKAQGGNIPTAPYRGMGEPGPGVCPLAPDPALLPTTLLAPDPALLPTTLLAQGVSQNVALVRCTELYRDFYKMILEQVLNISL